MKNFVQLDNRFFKISMDNGAPKFEEVKAEDAIAHHFEKIAITSDSEDDGIDVSMFQDVIDRVQVDMRNSLEDDLKSLVLQIMGFARTSNGRYVVNGFTTKDNSPVANMLADQLKERLLTVELAKDFDLTPTEKSKLKTEMRKTFVDGYEREVSQQVWQLARKQAQKDVEEVSRELVGDRMKVVARAIVENAISRKTKVKL